MAKGGLKDFLGRLIAATPESDLRSVASDVALFKAFEVEAEENPAENKRIIDQNMGTEDGMRVPGREEVIMGPTQASSGGGAEKMIREYSEPDPQQAVVERFEQFSRELGQMRGYMKSFAKETQDAIKAIVGVMAKGESFEDWAKEEKEEPEHAHKGAKAMADEMEHEDEDEGESHKAQSKAASQLFDAAVELFRRSQVARKGGDPTKARSLKAKAEGALEKAIGLIAKGGKDALGRAVLSDIHAFALVKGLDHVAAKAEKEEEEHMKAEREDERKEDEAHKADEHDGEDEAAKASEREDGTNQTKWPSGKSEAATMEELLKGNAILNGNLMSIMQAMQGKGGEGSVTPLGLISKGAKVAEGGDMKVLFKSNPAQWETVKRDQIDGAVQSGEFRLDDEMAANDIIAMASAVQQGFVHADTLVGRIKTSNESVRAMFEEVIA